MSFLNKYRVDKKLKLFVGQNKRSKLSLLRKNSNKCNFEWPTNKIRQDFLDFFCKENKHKFIKSSSVLPKKDSGTYFTNAGMNQFKSVILGEMNANDLIDREKYIGLANSQKCIRIGGKHNDLDDIGKDTYHHTFFEMLGNWSFGSYGTEKACELALTLLVNRYKLNMDGLYFTYFAGDKNLGIPADLDTKNTWLKLGVQEKHILPFDMKCNFWEMHVVGPCGPCTEIHYDRKINTLKSNSERELAAKLVNAGTERVIELWNIVFMNYNRIDSKTFSKLPNQVVDTGMGLERLSAVLNNLDSNYDSDLFLPLFDYIHSYSNSNISNSLDHYRDCKNEELLAAYRILSDHMRSICVSISDGLMPSRNGLGGFLKYLILKCMKISKETLRIKNETELLCNMVPIVIDTLKNAYPELTTKIPYIQEIIKNTEQKQKEKNTYSEEVIARYLKKLGNPQRLSGEEIWKLFKGDGKGEEISVELIKNECEKKRIKLDIEEFDKILLDHHEKSLKNTKNMRKDNSIFIELANRLKGIPKTDNSFVYSFDMNYDKKEATFKELNSKILALAVKNPTDKKYNLTNKINPGDECIVILDKTNFYPESGGQLSDKGVLKSLKNEILIRIENINHVQGYTFHTGKVEVSNESKSSSINNINLELNDNVCCEVDPSLRYFTSLNHTAVHILNHSIRKHYKNEKSILQTGSLVKSNYFKFEFKFSEMLIHKPSLEDLSKIQNLCNHLIENKLPIYIGENINLENEIEEKKLNYPVRLLNDVLYPRNVRIVSIGTEFNNFKNRLNNVDSNLVSAELCCGTHASNTSQLRKLVITSLNIVGDSNFEIEGRICKNALEIEEIDNQILKILSTIKEYHQLKSINENQMSLKDSNEINNKIAGLSIQIEEIFKTKIPSYLTLQQVKEDILQYRPSKYQLQLILKKYFEQELVIESSNSGDLMSKKLLVFNSILQADQIINAVLKKINGLYPIIALYNQYRNQLILYTPNQDDRINRYFDTIQNVILNENISSSVIEAKKNYRIIKCQLAPVNLDTI